jgi:hypothetical protein
MKKITQFFTFVLATSTLLLLSSCGDGNSIETTNQADAKYNTKPVTCVPDFSKCASLSETECKAVKAGSTDKRICLWKKIPGATTPTCNPGYSGANGGDSTDPCTSSSANGETCTSVNNCVVFTEAQPEHCIDVTDLTKCIGHAKDGKRCFPLSSQGKCAQASN